MSASSLVAHDTPQHTQPQHRSQARPTPSRTPSGPAVASSSSMSALSTPQRPPMAGGAGSPSGGATVASHLTLDAALAGAEGSHVAALDAVLAERNMLSSQNAQLWKLIEKQRVSYANAMKDLERIRGERDKAIARLDGARPKRQHSTPQKSSSTSTLPTTQPHSESPSNDPYSIHTPSRHWTDPSAPTTNGSASFAAADSARSSPNGDDNSSVAHSVVSEQPDQTPTSTPVKQPPSIITTFPSTPPRQSSSADAVSATPVNATDSTRPLQIAGKKHSLDSYIALTGPSPSSQTQHPNPHPLQQPPQLTASNMLMPFDDSKRSKRESRISIPQEARTYIQQMSDMPSPKDSVTNFAAPSSTIPNGYPKEQHSMSPVAENARERLVGSPERPHPLRSESGRSQSTTPPFLDMDNSEDEDDDAASIAPASTSGPSATGSAPIPIPSASHPAHNTNMMYSSESTTSPEPASVFSDDARAASTSASTSPAEDFPHAPTRERPLYDLGTPPNSPPVVNPSSSSSAAPQGSGPRPAFRAQRMTHPDLALTTLRIAGSNIRPNDRGKEVLSFVISVTPGNKDRYKIEKLYSEVLSLDARVRVVMSKSQLKQLAPLPDAKLFKDHAPAKVDLRKTALEKYLQTLIRVPMKNTDDVCAFFSSDIVRDAKAPVMQSGHKEGYLTKRGKNFGGWKTRYFVLQNSTLEYYESRGGTHLGSIVITGAQIGRQQRTQSSRADDEDNEFRHAFLIIEAKRGPGGQSPRHVLCAESDVERDAWVEVLVRYVTGAYDESGTAPGSQPAGQPAPMALPRSSTSSYDSSSTKRPRMSKDDFAKSGAVPISQLSIDPQNTKLYQSAPSISEAGGSSPVGVSPDRSPAYAQSQDSLARKILERNTHTPQNASEISLSNSVPSYLDVAGHHPPQRQPHPGVSTPRSASELGHYPDLKGPPPPGYGAPGQGAAGERPSSTPSRNNRASYHPSLTTVRSSPTSEQAPSGERSMTPDLLTPRAEQPRPGPEQPRAAKISGPMNGKPIPAGYNFGTSQSSLAPPEPAATPADKDRKGKVASRFWAFTRGDKNPVAAPVPTQMPRAVFGVTLQESLEVAEIARLPAIVFRCIQYLEAKRADQEEGIYRLSGSSAVIKSLRDRFNAEGDVDLLASDEFWDPHAIAGLLKGFLRDLPASILTRELHLRFLHVIDLMDPQERVDELQSLISQLPLANYSLLRALTAHLILVVQNSNVNKMTMRNVGIVFSPTLGIPAGVFSLMLGEFNRVFSVEPENRGEVGPDVEENPVDPAADSSSSHLSRRNSSYYADTAADRMLGLTGRSLPTSADDSDDGEELLSVHEESGTETENEGDVTLMVEPPAAPETDTESHQTHQSFHSQQSHHTGHPHTHHGQPPQLYVEQPQQTRPTERAQRASNVAASRGLQVNVPGGAEGRRVSGQPGLPASPRPRGPVTPTTTSNPSTSNPSTPR